MARPAEAQPTNKAGPNSYLQGVGRMPSGVAATPGLHSPHQGLPSLGPGRAWGAEAGGFTSLSSPSRRAGVNARLPLPHPAGRPHQGHPGPWGGGAAPCNPRPLPSSGQWRGHGRARRESRAIAAVSLSHSLSHRFPARDPHCPLEKGRPLSLAPQGLQAQPCQPARRSRRYPGSPRSAPLPEAPPPGAAPILLLLCPAVRAQLRSYL